MARKAIGIELSSASVDAVMIDGVSKVTNFILSKSGVVYCQSKKQLQDCIYQQVSRDRLYSFIILQ